MANVSLVDGHIDEPKKRPYDISPEPLWCEDCKHFCNADMGGEGMCDIDNHDTWYGCPICKKAELKYGEVKKQTNYDRIKAMSVEEMAEFIYNDVTEDYSGLKSIGWLDMLSKEDVVAWLESEVDTE